MGRLWRGLGVGTLAATMLSIFGCRIYGAVTHLIPDGYVGPVVIVFDDPNGIAPKRDERGGIVYEIPPDGVLRLSTPTPEAGWYDVEYFYIRPDGSRQQIPYEVDESTLQVFAGVTGATEVVRPPDRWTWQSYVVGIPVARDDWGQLREAAEDRAIGTPDPT